MIVVLKQNISPENKEHARQFLSRKGFSVREIVGEEETILGAVGKARIDQREVELLPGVDRVIPISKPYKLASRELKKQDTIVPVGRVRIGGNRVVVIAGPCAVESREQIMEAAQAVREGGAVLLRGGAFKPRTSPYSFQGLGEEGLKLLKEAGEKYDLPIVTEIVGTDYADLMNDYVDVFQVGARNMQNFELLKRVGSLGKPVILKRGLSATIEEWLMAAEYLMAHGSDNVILCERGIRTFETYTRNTLDLSAIPVVKKLSHLPVLVDPSHGTGLREKVHPMALAAVAAGADGLMVEVHPHPEQALSDGPQSLLPDQFEKLMRDLQALSPVIEREIERVPVSIASPTVSVNGKSSGKIAFQGMHGAYSERAIVRYFGEEASTLPCPSFRSVFETVLSGQVRFGVVPIENSLAGTIYENIDLLQQYPDITIVGEQKVRIIHNLIGQKGADIADVRKVFSHPQGLAQCSAFFDRHPEMERVPFYDTAGAVAKVSQMNDPQCAAIAGEEAAKTYNMEILQKGIETNPRNYTRFFVITRSDDPVTALRERVSMAAVSFATPDQPGALFACLKVFADNGLNMKKLESRPIEGKPWQYRFFVALEVTDEEVLKKSLTALEPVSDDLRFLGVYESR
ncbi:3-deoxy-7-phosphoheptulonate synthase [Sediminispirochaeta bajacaliforniensis]|uniref:3-deoxy-7-phosphoheptulonate synthase n=1 Tax=Sediminispirochaeta bajacaliforniensis TaxID=148 RepID=UPI00036C4233|nr:3-deoxy-7-phosphoheptulonate synthase [Sediminispirochaeta bajacaliforniensis]